MIKPAGARNPDILSAATGHFSVELGDAAEWAGHARELLGSELPAELARAVEMRRAEYVAGRYCALQALKQAGLPASVPGSEGRLPVWPHAIVGSITHKKGFVSAAVAPASRLAGIGIDCELEMSDED